MAERKEANFSQGWGYATFITALVVAAFVVAGTIKSRTYIHPANPSAPSKARAVQHAPATDGDGAAAH